MGRAIYMWCISVKKKKEVIYEIVKCPAGVEKRADIASLYKYLITCIPNQIKATLQIQFPSREYMQQVFVIIEMKKRKCTEVRKVIITQIVYEKDGKQRPV